MTNKGPEVITGVGILERIRSESGVDPNEHPAGVQLVWFNDPAGNPTEIRVGEDYPLNKGHKVFGIFHDEDEYRVYTLPGGPLEGMAAHPRCAHFSKHGPTYFVEIMQVPVLITRMAADWSLVGFDILPIDRIRVEIAEYIRAQKADKDGEPEPSLEDLATSIESGEYAEEDDEDPDEPEEPEAPETPGAPKPVVQ